MAMGWLLLLLAVRLIRADPDRCVTREHDYHLGETWNPDPCTMCTCSYPPVLRCSSICGEPQEEKPPLSLPHANSCSSNPCQNNGTCRRIRDDSHSCVCPEHYSGPNCEKQENQDESLVLVQAMEARPCEEPAIVKIWSRIIHEITDSRRPKLRCKAAGHPTPTISWSPIKDKTRFIVDKLGTLTIRNPKPEDAGVYTCIASNECGQASSDTEVVMKGFPEEPTTQASVTDKRCKRPTITKFTSRLVHEIGSRHARIKCKADGHPNPAVFWSPIKDKGRFFVNKLGTLTIRNPGPKDAGVYTCTVSNRCGHSSIATELIVGDPEKPSTPGSSLEKPCERPVITKFSSYLVHEVGPRHPKVVCKATGHPNLTISWSPIKDKRRFITSGMGTLTIRNVSADDAGVYTCSASNECGQASIQTNIIIIENRKQSITPLPVTHNPCERPTIDKVSSSMVHETGFSSIYLRCNATGYPLPTIMWSPIKDKRRYRFTVDNLQLGTMTIETPRDEDAGVYTCTASNECGQDSSEMNLVIDRDN